MSILFYLFLVIKLVFFGKTNSFSTNNSNNLNINENNIINNNANAKRNLQNDDDNYEPISIYFDTYYLTKRSLYGTKLAQERNIILYSLNKTKDTLEKLIKVPKGTAKINSNDYKEAIESFYRTEYDEEGEVDVFKDDPGLNAHLVIFVDYYNSILGPFTNYYNCTEYYKIIKSATNLRPTIGYIMINHNLFEDITNELHRKELFSYYLLHQTTHILGFTRNIIQNKIGIDTKIIKRNPKESYEKEIISNANLMDYAEKYFSCPKSNITGIELEELKEYSKCDEYIHWDSRILSGDYMTALVNVQDQAISEFTLILLQETKFYRVNLYTGGLMRFGKNAGCDFFNKDCNVPLPPDMIEEGQTTIRKSLFLNEFCAGEEKSTCSPGRQSRGICENYIISSLLNLYGGDFYNRDWNLYGNKFADFCPLSCTEKQMSKEITLSGSCKYGNNKFGYYPFYYWTHKTDTYDYSIFSNTYGEVIGSDNSFCAFSSVISKNDDPNKILIYKNFIRPTCYEMYCSDSSLTIRINDLYTVCPRCGGYISVEGKSSNYFGHLLCPDYNLICSQSVPCNNMFDCVEKNSTMKQNLKYDYEPVNVSTQIILPDISKTYPRAYELADNGICPRNCSQCNKYHHCYECNTSSPYHLEEKESDSEPTICSEIPPINNYYYNTSNITFYKCLPNCKVCTNAQNCKQCAPEYKLNENKKCIERIEGCGVYNKSSNYTDVETNGEGQGYKMCEECNKTRGYFCFNDNKQFCGTVKDDINSYFNNSFGCLEKCENRFPNCFSCSQEKCNSCKDGFYPNNSNVCLKKVEHCDVDNKASDRSECNKCEDTSTVKYRCLNHDKTKCIQIPVQDILNGLYFKVDYGDDTNDCVKKCSEEYDPKCYDCTHQECLNCIDNYFVYQNKCFEGIEHCKSHYYNVNTTIYCKQCKENYYCLNNNIKVCTYIDSTKIDEYHKSTYYGIDCYQMCSDIFLYCLKCNDSSCTECSENTYPVGDHCEVNPNMEQKGECKIQFHEINGDLNKLNISHLVQQYTPNFPNFNVIEHYVNENYTITVFIHSDCTEDLLNHGYFKINSNQLQDSMVKEFNANENLTYSIFITSNLKSHFIYYDDKLNYLNTTDSISAQNIEYIITNYYIRGINETLGPIVASLVESEKIDIFQRDSNVYNSYCQNITLLGIDMPLKRRLFFLYPNSFTEKIACLGEDCVIDEFNFDESTCRCNCKIGNNLDDILKKEEFKNYEGEMEEFNNFIDSIGVIKCLGNGFRSSNIKANAGFFLVIIGIVSQIVLYVFYGISGEPITSLPKNLSNPPKKNIILFSDWDKRIDKGISTETEVFIQPRDDADEQLLEEERTYSNDGNNASNISLDTNVEGENSKKKKLKYSEKPDTKVLILFKNRGKKQKTEKDDDLRSDSEIIKLNDNDKMEQISFCKIYWFIVSLKQHIINYFSFFHCCKITKSYIPLTLKIIRSIFLFFLSFVFNILFLNQNYYDKKFSQFDVVVKTNQTNLEISSKKIISFAISNTFVYAIISFILLVIVNFLVGFLFFSVRKSIEDSIKNNDDINDLISKTKRKYLLFFIINIILMVIFLLTITGFVGAYGGGFVDYFVAGIISLIFLEIFPFIWSLIIALFIYFGNKRKVKCLTNFGKFNMF